MFCDIEEGSKSHKVLTKSLPSGLWIDTEASRLPNECPTNQEQADPFNQISGLGASSPAGSITEVTQGAHSVAVLAINSCLVRQDYGTSLVKFM